MEWFLKLRNFYACNGILLYGELEVHSDTMTQFNCECLYLEMHCFGRIFVMFTSSILWTYRACQTNMSVLTMNQLFVPFCHLQVNVKNLTIFPTGC
jgi:hypothetical protein